MTNTTPTAPTYDATQILALPMDPGRQATRAATIRDYLVNLLAVVWHEGEGFSGKRPFGNSGWYTDLYKPLVKAGIIPGKFDEDGFLDDWDTRAGDAAITAAIEGLRAAAQVAPAETPEAPAGAARDRNLAAAVVARIADEIDEDQTYSGTRLIVHLTGLANGIRSGAAELPTVPASPAGGAR